MSEGAILALALVVFVWAIVSEPLSALDLHLKGGRPRFVYNFMGRDEFVREGTDPVAPGRHALRYEFEPTGDPDFTVGKGSPGRGQLYVDRGLVANVEFPHTAPLVFELEGLSCGYDFGAPGQRRLRAAVRLHRHHPQRHLRPRR